jgi:hypothetical protein
MEISPALSVVAGKKPIVMLVRNEDLIQLVGWVQRSVTQHPRFVGFRVAAPNLQ